jgi:hypothetical protein
MAVSHRISPALVTAVTLPMRIKLVAFDGFAIFDRRPVFGLAEQLFLRCRLASSNGGETRAVWIHLDA